MTRCGIDPRGWANEYRSNHWHVPLGRRVPEKTGSRCGASIGERHFRRRSLLRKKFGDGSAGVKVLDLTNEKPESVMRQAMLLEEATLAGMETDPEIVWLAERLAELLPDACLRLCAGEARTKTSGHFT